MAGFNQQHVRFFGMGRANVQVVSTRAGLHSLAHRYGRTISVFTKVLSSDRIILNQYSIRGDALWYALPALPSSHADPRRDSFTRRNTKNSGLSRSAFACSPTVTCRLRIRCCPDRTILNASLTMQQDPSASAAPDSRIFPSIHRTPAVNSACVGPAATRKLGIKDKPFICTLSVFRGEISSHAVSFM